MSSESDPVVDDVLRSAHAAAAPAPAELARALAGIRRRIVVPELPLGEHHRVPGDTAARAGRGAKWGAELRRLLGTGLALGVGFALGVQYERHSGPVEPIVALRSSTPELPAPKTQPAAPAAILQVPAPQAGATQLLAPRLEATDGARRVAALADVSRPTDAVQALRLPHGSKHRALPAAPASVRKHSDLPLPSAIEPAPFGFSEVVERVERAQHAERDLHPELAIELLDEVDARGDATMLREERLVTRVLADCDLGNVGAAQHALSELQSSAEAAVYASRVAGSCVAPRRNGASPSGTLR
jgi:hypothetical protein